MPPIIIAIDALLQLGILGVEIAHILLDRAELTEEERTALRARVHQRSVQLTARALGE